MVDTQNQERYGHAQQRDLCAGIGLASQSDTQGMTAVCRPYVPVMWFDTAQLRRAASAARA
jgi:hypothetical protein